MRDFWKIFDLLSPGERRRAGFLILMVLVMALLDVIGIASIMPFMALLADPGLVENNVILSSIYVVLDLQDVRQFLFVLGLFAFALLILSLAFKAFTTYMQLRFVLMREYSIGKRLIEGYLRQPYSWFLARNSADLGKSILSEVNTVIGSGMMPMMNLIAQGVTALVLLTVLVLVDPILAITVGIVLGVVYAVVSSIFSGLLVRIGQERLEANKQRFSVVSEVFGAIKEVKIAGLESIYVRYFADSARIYAEHQATAQVIGQFPRFILEAVAFGGMLLVTLYLMSQSGGISGALPVISFYAFSGYRLLPALQQIYASVTRLRFSRSALDALHADLGVLAPSVTYINNRQISFKGSICLSDVSYTYPGASCSSLNEINLCIPAKAKIGLVGKSGSGKTTLVDLIIGLLEPQRGTLKIDGETLGERGRARAWGRTIGYVPQHIYLADDTVAANIAFGADAKHISQTDVEKAARIANLHDFVVSELSEGYETLVGERGVRLSGGQRQRIGIARALYHSPQVLIMDEATSALDNHTEQMVMDAVRNLDGKVTIILIAHRLSTVRDCDQIYLLSGGRVEDHGTYDELKLKSGFFGAEPLAGRVV